MTAMIMIVIIIIILFCYLISRLGQLSLAIPSLTHAVNNGMAYNYGRNDILYDAVDRMSRTASVLSLQHSFIWLSVSSVSSFRLYGVLYCFDVSF